MTLKKYQQYNGTMLYRASDVEADPNCRRCKGFGWVCEDHPTKAHEGHVSFKEGACQCCAPGIYCECAIWPDDHPMTRK